MKRLNILVNSDFIAEKLYQRGIHSALKIASMTLKRFIFLYSGDVFDGNDKAAELTWRRANARKTQVIHHYVALKTHASAHYNASRFANLSLRRKTS